MLPAPGGLGRLGDDSLEVGGGGHLRPAGLLLLPHSHRHPPILVDPVAGDALRLPLLLHLLQKLRPGSCQLKIQEDVDILVKVVASLIVLPGEHSS